ncbi:hypothetical protein A33M_2465 [Rhodovulum sp. PH10]|nr:hypothetical protein A33M_2465 [Rhodovulum sp. PH10]
MLRSSVLPFLAARSAPPTRHQCGIGPRAAGRQPGAARRVRRTDGRARAGEGADAGAPGLDRPGATGARIGIPLAAPADTPGGFSTLGRKNPARKIS